MQKLTLSWDIKHASKILKEFKPYLSFGGRGRICPIPLGHNHHHVPDSEAHPCLATPGPPQSVQMVLTVRWSATNSHTHGGVDASSKSLVDGRLLHCCPQVSPHSPYLASLLRHVRAGPEASPSSSQDFRVSKGGDWVSSAGRSKQTRTESACWSLLRKVLMELILYTYLMV